MRSYTPEELQLTGDFGYGDREAFAHHARMAVRLSNFISAFLQVSYSSSIGMRPINSIDVLPKLVFSVGIRSERSVLGKTSG